MHRQGRTGKKFKGGSDPGVSGSSAATNPLRSSRRFGGRSRPWMRWHPRCDLDPVRRSSRCSHQEAEPHDFFLYSATREAGKTTDHAKALPRPTGNTRQLTVASSMTVASTSSARHLIWCSKKIRSSHDGLRSRSVRRIMANRLPAAMPGEYVRRGWTTGGSDRKTFSFGSSARSTKRVSLRVSG